MSDVISINSKKVLGQYIDARSGELIPEEAYFFAGVFLSVVLPQWIFYVYGGLVPGLAFAASAVSGSLFGVAKYRSSYRPLPCVVGAAARVPPREGASCKRAA